MRPVSVERGRGRAKRIAKTKTRYLVCFALSIIQDTHSDLSIFAEFSQYLFV